MKLDKLTKPQLVTISVALLGGHLDFVDREDVAEHVNKLAPGRFTWKKYPERIDLETVGNALRHAKKKVYGALITGNTTAGWMLSPSGIKWVNTVNLETINNTLLPLESISGIQEAEIARLRHTRAYRLYYEDKCDDINLQDFYQFTRVNEYFQNKSKQRRYSVIENAVSLDSKLSDLWVYLKNKFIEEVD